MLFHVMGHKVQKDEAYMQVTMAGYIENHSEGINIIASDFLKCKGQTSEDYLDFIRVPGNKGDELAVHLLACMANLKVAVVTKTGFWSTVMDCDPFSADVVFVYLGKSTFRDTTPIPSKPTPIPAHIDDKVEEHEVDPKVDGNK